MSQTQSSLACFKKMLSGLFTVLNFFVGVEGRVQGIARDLDASAKRLDQGGRGGGERDCS